MAGRRRNLVEAGADLVWRGELTGEAYAVHFEAQMHRGRVRKAPYVSYLHFARAGASLAGRLIHKYQLRT
jgi:hypothetical protein